MTPIPFGRTDAVPAVPAVPAGDDPRLIASLRRGDEAAFLRVVEAFGPAMLRLALVHAPNRAVAEEVVQEAWLAVVRGLAAFEGRSSLKTWCCRIAVNIAKTRGEREGRQVPFSAWESGGDPTRPGAEAERVLPPGTEETGRWVSFPPHGDEAPEPRTLAGEIGDRIRDTLAMLPPMQRAVISLRDFEGWPSDEVCDALAISATNQRVLLHRARMRVRRELEPYLAEDDPPRAAS